MDTRWVRTWKPDESRTSGRRAKARLTIKGFTDPDLPNTESHSPALTREGFMIVLQSLCSHGHKLLFGDVQQAFNTGDPIKRGQPLFVRVPPDGIPGESREVWVQLLKTVNGLVDDAREWRNAIVMNEELVQNGVMNEKFVKNFVMNAKIDPKVVMDLSIF